ncbi:MAG: TonB-dependent receptor [Ignavibacteria bacterium]|nr:TonB-dependent receptor [Bacteroidota bacterium]MSQ46209.1 TonB-dependent receptor [Ignavibacteria bacterium]
MLIRKFKNTSLRLVLFSLFLITININSAISGITGKLTGYLKDAQTNEPLIGVTVLIKGTTSGASTDIEGYFSVLNIPPGVYTVTASMIGYSTTTFEKVKISIDQTTNLNINLKQSVLEIGDEVVVIAERPLIRKDMTSVEARVDAEAIKNMPVQEVRDILNLQAGVTMGRGGEIHIRGGRASEVAYWVDGKSVTDVFDGSQSISVESNAIQELQVVSGTFNAEYGNAMSGIVNIVTKDGGEKFAGNLMIYSGDYYSKEEQIFQNIGDFNISTNKNIEGSLSGPLIPGSDLSFYFFGRNYSTDGWLYGRNVFTIDGDSADGKYVAMNPRNKTSLQTKIKYQITPLLKLTFSLLGSQQNFRDYNHFFSLQPDGDVKKFDKGYDLSALLSHSIGTETFYTINLSKFQKDFREYLFEDPLDSRYLHPDSLNEPGYSFTNMGTNLHHFNRNTTSYVFKFDVTSQLNKLHQTKFGFESRQHKLFYNDFTIVPADDSIGQQIRPFKPAVLDKSTSTHDNYTRNPIEYSFYAQDKIEYNNFIINAGLRYDYFDSKGDVLTDPEDPNIYLPFKLKNKFDVNGDGKIDVSDDQTATSAIEKRRKYWYKKASPKKQISPRFGIAYPITDQGVIHFSYGHFLQIPSFSYLYQRPEYKVTSSGGLQGGFGNPDLNPQRTVMYEIGLQQQLSDEMSMDVTGFYRDIRDWVTSGPAIEVQAGTGYSMYINKDYANVRGIALSLNKRLSNFYTFNFSYTFQVAEGVNSSPDEEYFAQVGNSDPAKQLTSLDWDQTHTANFSLGLEDAGQGGFMILRYGSGLPYTPVIITQLRQGQSTSNNLIKNSRRRPDNFTTDLRLYKNIKYSGFNFNLFCKVTNLFDRRNELDVFGDTGRANKTLQTSNISQDPSANNTIAEWFNFPTMYSEPREVQIGFEIGF